jgi:L-alanine-DL-glutamate epimerase-like enolase superfamily enzyme
VKNLVDRMTATLAVVPLGAARGGSGATELSLVHVTVTDSDGATGTGFTYALGSGAEAIMSMLAAVHSEALNGLPVTHWERTWYGLRERSHRLGRGVTQLATSAVDIAIWDLRARQLNLPLYQLLGGQRDQVPIYGSGRATHAMSTDELVAGASAYLAEGYSAIKLRAGAHPPAADLARTAAVREAVGPGVTIMIDCNERLDLATAHWLSVRLSELGVYWLEEPLPATDIDGHRALASRSPIPLALGEHLQGLSEFVPFAQDSVASVLQPDAPITGGISEFMRIATLAESHRLALSPHFLPELHIHLAAASRAATWIEHFPLIDDLLTTSLHPKDRMVAVPQVPGHGMAWDGAAIEHFATAHIDSAGKQP